MEQTTSLGVKRLFTPNSSKAYDQLKWVKRNSIIKNPMTDKSVFEQSNLDFPEDWSLNAINIVAQRYFSGAQGTKEREDSLRTLIDRVVDTITKQGLQEGYFGTETEAEDFREELKYVLATQRATFNSPVWFNIGVKGRSQQASSCFILGIEDTMPSILNWYVEEGMIFKGGSGTGINLSPIRSSVEKLDNSTGDASGPLSFMRGADSLAGAINSGNKMRRAAKTVILNVDHPDIEEFIWSKAIEGRKARDLESLGWDMGAEGKDSFSIQYQNATTTVRVTDDFMRAVKEDGDWELKAVNGGKTVKTVKAAQLLKQFAEASWESADPGMQFDSTINDWNTTPKAGRINGSNPCSEYMHLDNSASNLASLNLLTFLNDDNTFDIKSFIHTSELIFTAQEILVGYSEYPTESMGKNTRAYREVGIGYANLGALLMALGLAYDSDEGRAVAATITALLTGHAYATSAKIAKKVGPFTGFAKDREGTLKVLKMHRSEVSKIDASLVPEELLSAATNSWDEAVEQGELYGVRNSQASALAPTGTTGLMMDCETTGIEPELGLVRAKKLESGDSEYVVSEIVSRALKALGYTKPETEAIVAYIEEEQTIIGAPKLKDEHIAVFACSIGDNSIHYQGHIKMMAAVQPFISGAISKTVNMPEEVGVEDIEQLHLDAWEMGLKAISVYRENSKVTQAPIKEEKEDIVEPAETADVTDITNDVFIVKGAVRRELPKHRNAKTFSFTVSGVKGYVTVGEYEDGNPGEVFMKIAKQGSTLAGIMDSLAVSVSYGLQYGVPLKSYVHGLTNMSFAPSGITDDADIRTASSLVDYIFRRLALSYLNFYDLLELGMASIEDMPELQTSLIDSETEEKNTDSPKKVAELKVTQTEIVMEAPKAVDKPKILVDNSAAPICYNCGNQTQRAGSCYVCGSCGSTTGCS